LWALPKLDGRLSTRRWQFDWQALRPELRFGAAIFSASTAANAAWAALPLIIGAIRGPAAIVPFHIGQKFPLALTAITWRLADVFFPAASQQPLTSARGHAQALLEMSVRWIAVVALPASTVLWILAPNLLQAWLGEVQPEMLLILRLMTVWALFDSIGAGAYYVLWARNNIRPVLAITSGTALVTVVLTLGLTGPLGAVGAAIGLAAPTPLAAILLVWGAAHLSDAKPWPLIRASWQGLLAPWLACAAVAAGLAFWLRPQHWAGTIAVAVPAGAAFLVTLYFTGNREEERHLMASGVTGPVRLGRSLCRKLAPRRRVHQLRP
ncbi:MAG TPA: oligosaccharide flippase family protein, partial [Chloroflexota bacterium]